MRLSSGDTHTGLNDAAFSGFGDGADFALGLQFSVEVFGVVADGVVADVEGV